MQCPTCTRQMVSVFYSQKCDYCDFAPSAENLHKGYIVLSNSEFKEGHEEYVFRAVTDAERWRVAAGRDDNSTIRIVLSTTPYRWHVSRGTLRDVVLADHMFQIYTTHKHPNLPHCAFLKTEE